MVSAEWFQLLQPLLLNLWVNLSIIFPLNHFLLTVLSWSSLGLKGILKMPGLELGTSRLSMLSETKRTVRLQSALHPRWPERAHLLYIGARTWRAFPAFTVNRYRTEKKSWLQDSSGFSEPLSRARISDAFTLLENEF